MPRGKAILDRATLEMALIGYEFKRDKIEETIRAIRAELKGKAAPAPAAAAPKAPAKRKRRMSAAARARIAAAQKKRWAEFHKRTAEGAKG